MVETGAPTVFLLVGLTGSGKTTHARRVLEPRGAVRLSVDEVVFERYGRYGVDYPENAYFEKEAPVVAELHERLVELVAEGRDVVWDHGLWPREEREAMKRLVESAGGRWRLMYFPVGRDELLRRLAARNERVDANALVVTTEALDDFLARFEEPRGEGEEIVDSDWL
ncbi:ATP-binding protein [Streptomyces sp. NPDC004520]|uniref:ATP-binding protein n=1 Tax=Streptomyces sp. NPDC004520 TaxID=3364702 RepID=UPI00368EA091